jgi:Rap1a immunity proteins
VLINWRLLIATVATVVSFNACADVLSGNEWLADCSANENFRKLACLRFAEGVANGIALWAGSSRANAPMCLPDGGVSTGQVQDVGVRYVRAHPEIRHLPAATLLLAAFKEAWPCPTHPSAPR